ncbi:invasion associated locus B family protein [Komagataeibacter swingsii]|uniref:Invasion associated locus B family protein n=1 Tax=Komagataeibacter swingsii TaxID=215220 RepID=A0A850PCE7_9PROT|nr:invasion associated locus B family protein [Komagataeibacter swingsii]NVN38661.1 invasion associated locus B family protein [Komagataeibacter swingsii]
MKLIKYTYMACGILLIGGMVCIGLPAGIRNGHATTRAPAVTVPPTAKVTTPDVQSSMEIRSQTAGAWSYRCLYPHQDNHFPARCLVQQQLVVQNQKKQPMVIGAIVFSRDRVKDTSSLGPYELLVETPQGMALNQQAAISIDTGAFIPLQWQTCVGRVCIAQLNSLSDSLLEQFSHGKTGHIRMTSLRGSVLSISFELNGISHAFDTINNWIK